MIDSGCNVRKIKDTKGTFQHRYIANQTSKRCSKEAGNEMRFVIQITCKTKLQTQVYIVIHMAFSSYTFFSNENLA